MEKRDLPSLTPLAAAETLFRSAAPGAQIRLRDDGDAVLVPRSTASGGVNHRPGALRLDFVGANSDVRAVGLQRGDGVSDFIALNGRAYDKVVYRNVYDGIDVLYRQTPENHFEFVFLIRPAGDPADIKIAYRGAKRVSLDDAGHLDIRLANTRLVEKAPFAYQRGDIGAHAVGILPRLDNQGRLGFRVGDYDPSNLLVIDPETNFPPEAIDESYGTTHDQALIVDAASGVLSNDWDNESDPLTAVLVSGPSHGTLTLYASGAFDYEPDEAYAGGDSFTYKAFDGTSFSGTATVSIDVINNVPIAINDSYDVTHDQVLTADAMSGVAGNDWDGDGDQMIVSLVSDVSHGDLSLNSDGSFVYEPAAAYAGTDSFTYKLFDGVAYSDVGTATIQVINNLPSALTDSYETLHDEPLTVDVFSGVLGNDWDGDGDQMFVSVVTGPSHGDLMLNADGSFEYEPDEHYVGGDSFTYKAYDGVGYSDPATVTIQMTNSAPEVFLDGPIDGLPGEPVTLSGWFTDSDNPVYDGPYTLKVNWGDGTAVQQFSFATPGSFQYEHTYAAAGLYTVSVDVIDVVGAFAQAQVPARVTVVQSVAWVALDSPLDANPGNGIAGTAIGQRIFPDRLNAGDAVNRKRVQVRATVFPAVAGITVFFKAIDVDDPSANTAPVDRETDGANEVPDNRGVGALTIASAVTDANGVALGEFEVSLQPGDNWRIAAARQEGKLTGLKGKQNDAPQLRVVDVITGIFMPTAAVKVTEVLTVWRRLHVEVDSMGAVTGNTVTGTIGAPVAGAEPGTWIVTTNQNLADSVNRFENGWLTDSAGNVFPVVSNTAGPNFTVTVDDDPVGAPPAAGAFSLVDDDLLQDGQDVPLPDTSTLAQAVREAYVTVLFDVGDSNNNVPFVRNVDADFFQIVSDNWTSKNSNNELFWVAYVLGAFQGGFGVGQSRDHDPNTEGTRYGETSPTGGSLIYLEANRDGAIGDNQNVAVYERDTVVHEVGHAVANSAAHPVTGGDSDPVGTYSRYVPAYLHEIRSITKPWSPENP